MSHFKAIVRYVRIVALVTKVGGELARLAKEAPKVAAIVNYISPSVIITELPTPVIFGTWDNGLSFWDLDGGGLPQSQWDIGL